MSIQKPFAPACENNKAPILNVLRDVFSAAGRVLEIGSGTGQHAVYFAAALAHLRWQPSDLAERLPGIQLWLNEAALENIEPPLALDVAHWPALAGFDGVFSANTAHIMAWPQVEQMFQGAAQALVSGGQFCLYGPFNVDGQHTSEGNARFDAALRAGGSGSGLRDIAAVSALAERCGMVSLRDVAMPANNRILIFRKVKPKQATNR